MRRKGSGKKGGYNEVRRGARINVVALEFCIEIEQFGSVLRCARVARGGQRCACFRGPLPRGGAVLARNVTVRQNMPDRPCGVW